MSLIADSLKKAVKEKSVPPWDPNREINVVGKRDPLKHPGLWSVFRVGLLIVLPTAILVYLISTGAFDLKKPAVSSKPDLPLVLPPEEAKAPSAPEISAEISREALPKTPSPEPSPESKAEIAPALDRKAVPPKASPSLEKGETSFKKVLPPYPLKKKDGKKPEQATEVQGEKQEIVALPSAVIKPEASDVPKNLPKGSEEEALIIVPPEGTAAKPLTAEPPVVETKAVVPETPPVVQPAEEKISETKMAKIAEIPAQPEIAKKSEIPVQPSEEKVGQVLPVEPPAKPLIAEPPVVERKAEVAAAPPAVKPAEEKIPELEIAKITEILAKPIAKPTLEKPQPPSVSSKITEEKKEKQQDLTIAVQREKGEIASLPSPILKPEISRTDPALQEDVFQNSDFYFNRAIFFQQAKDWDKALDNYVKAEQLDPNNPDTYNNKGVIYKEQRKYDKALDEFLRAIFLDPNYAKAYNNIGVVYYMQENYAEGIRNYLKAIDLNPSNLEAFNNLAIIYKKQKDLEKARAVLNRALAMDPDHPGTNYNLAVLYEENREITPALHYYRRFIELGTISYPSLVNQVKKHVETLKPQ